MIIYKMKLSTAILVFCLVCVRLKGTTAQLNLQLPDLPKYSQVTSGHCSSEDRITTEKECKEAAVHLNAIYGNKGAWSTVASGCVYDKKLKKYYFNTRKFSKTTPECGKTSKPKNRSAQEPLGLSFWRRGAEEILKAASINSAK